MIILAPLLSYQDKFTDEMVFCLFHKTAIRKAICHATDIFGSNIEVCLIKCNIIAEISWPKAPLAKRQSLTFDKNDKAIEFQMKFESILKHIWLKKRLCLAFNYQFAYTVIGTPVEEKQLSAQAQKLFEQQCQDKADKKMKAKEIKIIEKAKMIQIHQVLELKK